MLTEREIFGLHHEIKVLMERYGISYKDAAHRLYMTEWEKVRKDDRCKKAFSILADRTRGSLLNIRKKLNDLNATLAPDADVGGPKDKIPEAGGQMV